MAEMKRRKSDDTAITSFLTQLNEQVTNLKFTQLNYDGIINKFIKDLDTLGGTVNNLNKLQQERPTASMEEVRRLFDLLKDQLQDIEIASEVLENKIQQLKEDHSKLSATQQEMLRNSTKKREHLIILENTISQLKQDLQDFKMKMFQDLADLKNKNAQELQELKNKNTQDLTELKTELASLRSSHESTTVIVNDSLVSFRTLKIILISLAGVVGFIATAYGLWQSLVNGK